MRCGTPDPEERYIRRVGRALRLPRRQKAAALRDLREAFASAREHGEPAERVVDRLGPPKAYAAAIDGREEGAGTGRNGSRGKGAAVLPALLAAAAASCLLAAWVLRHSTPPADAIGYAEQMTGMVVTGGSLPDARAALPCLGGLLAAAAGLAAVLLRRRKNKKPKKDKGERE